MSATRLPARASTMAAHDPAGPAPTTIASKSDICIELDEELSNHVVGVAHDGEIGKLHHRAVRIEVHTDDVLGLTEAAGVLHGTADTECDVELWIDDHAGCADLAFVPDPAAVGDDSSCACRRLEMGSDRRELRKGFG